MVNANANAFAFANIITIINAITMPLPPPMPTLCLPNFFFFFLFLSFNVFSLGLAVLPPPSTSTQPKWASPQVCQFFFSAMLCTHNSHPHSLGLQRRRGSTLTPHCQHMNTVPLAMEVALDQGLSSPLMCSCYDFSSYSPFSVSMCLIRITFSESHSSFRQPHHLPFHCHTSLHHHLLTWLFLILISDSDSLCLLSYLRRLILYLDLLWQAPPRPFLYLTLASTMTKP